MAESAILTAERLELRPFNDCFLSERYVGWLNDKQTVRYSEQRHRRHTLETCRTYAHSFANTPNYFWAIIHTDPSVGHIGNITATVDVPNRVADLAILVGESQVRGQGYGFEAWARACRFLLQDAGLRKVTAGTMGINEPMLRIMRASGMVEEGRRRGQFLVDGKAIDAVLMALFAK
jgi:[ribosomal protein S5]-alanine N-acetyltransferase